MRITLIILALTLPLFLGCGERPDTVRVDGSSTVFPIARAAVEAYQHQHPDRRIVASSSGTAAGFQRFLRGETDINNASRPIRGDEEQRAQDNQLAYIELPIGYDGLAVIANPQNTWLECLTVSELRAIWQRGSTIQNWSDVREDFPDEEIRLYGRSPASGTFDYFTTAINGERGNIRDQYNASDTDNAIVQGVSRDRFGLAFFGLAYYESNRDILRLVAVDDEDPTTGEGCVLPTEQTVQDGTYQPLARPEFVYVNASRADESEAVRDFVDFFITNAAGFVRQSGYIPFDDAVYERIHQRFRDRVTGSMFHGAGPTTGVRIGDLLERMDARRTSPASGDEPASGDAPASGV
jgi:phosphate transport system substrate-binding protein